MEGVSRRKVVSPHARALVVAHCRATFEVCLDRARQQLFQAHFNISECIDPLEPEPAMAQMLDKLQEGMRVLMLVSKVVVVERDN